jgi:hypothetical protein
MAHQSKTNSRSVLDHFVYLLHYIHKGITQTKILIMSVSSKIKTGSMLFSLHIFIQTLASYPNPFRHKHPCLSSTEAVNKAILEGQIKTDCSFLIEKLLPHRSTSIRSYKKTEASDLE